MTDAQQDPEGSARVLAGRNATPDADPRFAHPRTLFFVIGAQKSGTTWLAHYLRNHSQVSLGEWKEYNYWNLVEGTAPPDRLIEGHRQKRLREGRLRTWTRQIGWQRQARRERDITRAIAACDDPRAPHSAYADAIMHGFGRGHLAAGEICPQYANLSVETFRSMDDLNPNTRFVYVMRDPVARFASSVRHSLRNRHGEGAITEELMREAVRKTANDATATATRLSRYDETIDRLEEAVPSERVHLAFYERLFFAESIETLCTFLGLETHPAPFEEKVHEGAAKHVRLAKEDEARLARSLREVYAFARDRWGDDLPEPWRRSAELALSAGPPSR